MSISILIFSLQHISGDVIGQKKVICLRVQFHEDQSSGTTGNGHFLMNPDTTCGNYIIDPPPHDKAFFQSQLKAVNNYFQSVSYQKFGIDLEQSQIFPESNDSVFTLPFSMNYYNPYGEPEELKEERLVKLFKDAISLADSLNSIPFEDFDFVIVFHAGIGQDFNLPYLDPTPEDIPSTYIDRNMLGEPFLGVEHGIILPETENHLLYEEGSILFDQSSQPCDYQYGLTGVMALMVGFASGLPPLWDLESGESRIGIFGLMDQGSNNGRGLIPTPPDAWTRIFAGWESPMSVTDWSVGIALSKRSENNIVKVNMTNSEYFLIENRNNWIHSNVSIDSLRYAHWEETDRHPPFIEILIDSVDIEKDENGVITSIPNYDLGLPASGLLIWHIDEKIISEGVNDYSINSDRVLKGVDLEEADGAQDIGFPSIFLFQDPSSGYFGDMWFDGNPEFERLNSGFEFPEFSHITYPNTHTNSGTKSYFRIFNISEPGDTMNFSLSNLYQLNGFPDSTASFHSKHTFNAANNLLGGKDSIWWASNHDPFERTIFYNKQSFGNSLFFTRSKENEVEILSIIEHGENSSIWNKFEWNENENIYNLIEQTYFDSIIYILADLDTDVLFSVNDESYNEFLNSAGVIQENETIAFYIDENILTINSGLSDIKSFYFDHNLINLIAIDIDLDGRGDAIILDEKGTLFVIDQNGIYFPGFPINESFGGNLFASDLWNDNHPEIIVEELTDRKFCIINWKGEIELSFPLSISERVKFISESLISDPFDSMKNLLVKEIGTSFSIWHFSSIIDSSSDYFCCNEWNYPNADMRHTRTIKLNYSITTSGQDQLFDSKRTYAYPNPATEDYVKIRVQVESANKIECKIYDLAGFYIDKLSLENPIQGMPNEIIWNVSDVESGIYYVDLVAKGNNKSQSKLIKAGIVH
jgi:hypothetical protein